MNQFMAIERWKQMRGKIRKLWGKLTRNPHAEFLGEQDRMEGKIEEYYARRNGDSRSTFRQVHTGGAVSR